MLGVGVDLESETPRELVSAERSSKVVSLARLCAARDVTGEIHLNPSSLDSGMQNHRVAFIPRDCETFKNTVASMLMLLHEKGSEATAAKGY